jgi:hypothetical protein
VDYVGLISDIWPVFVGFIVLVMSISKLMTRVEVLEEKVKSLFDLYNNRGD